MSAEVVSGVGWLGVAAGGVCRGVECRGRRGGRWWSAKEAGAVSVAMPAMGWTVCSAAMGGVRQGWSVGEAGR